LLASKRYVIGSRDPQMLSMLSMLLLWQPLLC